MRYVIVGDGAAGVTAAHYIRSTDPSGSLTIVADDPNPAYYRAALTNYLMGELREAQLFAVPPDFYTINKIERLLARVASLQVHENRLALADGRRLEYDQLMIASGSRPNTPTFPGAELLGVMTMRTLQDVRTVMDGVRSGYIKRALVVGGGPLGIEWVQGLLRYKVFVTYLLRGEVFFERALDRTASDLVISRLRSEGVDVRTNEEIEEAIGDRNGRLRSIKLKNSKQTIDCQLMGAAIGIRPNVEFLENSSIEIARDDKRGTLLGVVVDRHMRTNIPNIYAGGDVILRTLGLWEPARLQGRVAGKNMCGGSETYRMGAHYNATRLYDLDFASVGDLTDKSGDQVLIDFPRGSGRIAYRKFVIRENKLAGALMLGQRKERVRRYGLYYKKLIDAGVDISQVAGQLLDPEFDLPNWIDSLNLNEQISIARSIVMTGVVPSAASVRKSEKAAASKTIALQPVRTASATLHLNGKSYPIERSIKIGRQSGSQIILKDKLVSSRHAQIDLVGDSYIIKDENSTNGTFLNEVRVTSPSVLKDGDIIRIGETKLRFELHPVHEIGISSMPEEIPVNPVTIDAVLGVIEYSGRQIEIRSETVTLGRDPDATITISDPAASFMHAQISRLENQLYLRDLGSRNGTFVNGAMLVTPCILKDGDVINIGEAQLKFHARNTGVVPQTPPDPNSFKSLVLPQDAKSISYGRLVIRSGATLGLSFALKPPRVTVGREQDSNDIALNNQTVSRNHARLDWRNDRWVCTDLESVNGTNVSGVRLKAGVETPITDGAEVLFGDVKLAFEAKVDEKALSSMLLLKKSAKPFIKEELKEDKPKSISSLAEEIKPSELPKEIGAVEVAQKEASAAEMIYEEEAVSSESDIVPVGEAESPPVKKVEEPQPLVESQKVEVKSEATQFFQTSFPTRLKILSGAKMGQTIMLVNLPITIGRATAAGVQGLDDPLVSRQHLDVLLMPDGSIGVKDRGSVNGTYLNGDQLQANQIAAINKGDELRLGSVVLKVE